MILGHPWLMGVALAAALAGLVWLIRPPRRRIATAYVALWRQAAAQAGRARPWRRPRVWMILIAAGGLLLAGSAGGLLRQARHDAAGVALIVVSDSPQLMATDERGRLQKDVLGERLDRLFEKLDRAARVRIVVEARGLSVRTMDFAADVWPAQREELALGLSGLGELPDATELLHTFRREGDGAVYLLGEFGNVPAGGGVQWIFRPAPPARDAGIVSAGAEIASGRGELFISVQRFSGPGGKVTAVATDPTKPDVKLATVSLDLSAQDRAGGVAPLPADFAGPIRIQLADRDSQPLNDAFQLAAESAKGAVSVQVVGRPSEWISKAIASSSRLVLRSGGQERADWLIANEPGEAVLAGAGQGLVLIDPLTPPEGVRLLGELRDVKVVSHLAAAPWGSVPLDGVAARRATKVAIDPRWEAVASDADGNPLIAYRASTRQVAIFFSLAADNCDWFGQVSWPVFWDALAGLGGGGRAAGDVRRWAWRAGTPPGLRKLDGREVAFDLPAETFAPADPAAARAVNLAEILPPPAARATAARPVWSYLAGAAAALLAIGWWLRNVLTARRKEG